MLTVHITEGEGGRARGQKREGKGELEREGERDGIGVRGGGGQRGERRVQIWRGQREGRIPADMLTSLTSIQETTHIDESSCL